MSAQEQHRRRRTGLRQNLAEALRTIELLSEELRDCLHQEKAKRRRADGRLGLFVSRCAGEECASVRAPVTRCNSCDAGARNAVYDDGAR